MNVLIVKHIENEDAGTILDYLEEKGISYEKASLYEGDLLPENFDGISHIVVLGGAMNVYEEDKFPFLKDENAFIKRALKKNIPFIGICLGAQLLAKALDEKVYRAAHKEVGVMEVELADVSNKDELGILKHAPKNLMTLQWHYYTFDIPNEAKLLASSKLVRNQAFVVNKNAYGLQFHMEVNEEMVRDWFKGLKRKDRIVSDFLKIEKDFKKTAYDMYEEFFKL